MPDLSLEVTGGTNRLPVQASTPVEKGLLLSLSAFIIRGSTTTGRTHVLAGITTSALPSGIFHTVLIDDYVYNAHSPSWTGTLLLEPGDAILAVCRSADGATVRVMGRTIMQPFPVVTIEP